jgi:hypothetical protein
MRTINGRQRLEVKALTKLNKKLPVERPKKREIRGKATRKINKAEKRATLMYSCAEIFIPDFFKSVFKSGKISRIDSE